MLWDYYEYTQDLFNWKHFMHQIIFLLYLLIPVTNYKRRRVNFVLLRRFLPSLFFCLSVSAWPGDTLSCQDRLRLLGAASKDQAWHPGIGMPCLVYHPSLESPQPQWRTAITKWSCSKHCIHTHFTTLKHAYSFYNISRAAMLNLLT